MPPPLLGSFLTMLFLLYPVCAEALGLNWYFFWFPSNTQQSNDRMSCKGNLHILQGMVKDFIMSEEGRILDQGHERDPG
jgi:hypothetical protein